MNQPHTLDAFIDSLHERGERPVLLALQDEGVERWSYADLADRVRRLAHGLVATGVERGDRIAILAGNRPEWIAACLAVIRAGAVVVPLDVQLSDKVFNRVLDDSGARLLFTTSDQAERLKRIETEAKPEVALLDAGAESEQSWQKLLREDQGTGNLPQAEPDDVATLFYTSGTTGPPKGVPLSHGNLAFQLNTMLEAEIVEEGDHVLLPLPLHHVYPFVIGMLTPLALGLPIVLPRALTGPQLVRALREGDVSVIVGVPRLYRALYTGIQTRAESQGRIAAAIFRLLSGLSTWLRRRLGVRAGKTLLRPLHKQFGTRLRMLASGGSPLDPELAWKLEGLGWQIAIGYGLTETSPLLTLNPPGRARLESVGQAIPGVELRIDPAAHPGEAEETKAGSGDGRPARQQGEVIARGPNIFAGYRNLPDKTQEAFTDDGWFRTGDLGYFDDDGYLYILGRASTLIVTEGGKNVQPDEVEEAYAEHPAIREAGVLQKEGRLVAAIVPEASEIRRGNGETEQVIRQAVESESRRLPSYQRISDFAITRDTLPRTRLGKIRRHLLEERYEQARQGKEPEQAGPIPPEKMSNEDRNLLEHPAAKQTWDLFAQRFADFRLTPDTSPQLDLGVDSLEWMNLTMEIRQRVGVELSEEALGRIETVRDLLAEVSEGAKVDEAASPTAPLEHPEEALSDRQKQWLKPLGPVQSALARGLFLLNKGTIRGLFRLRVEGLEHLPKEGHFVIAANHLSYLDPFAIAATLEYQWLRRTYWAGWTGTAFRNRLTRFVSRLTQTVPIDPQRGVMASLAFGAAVLKSEQNLVWFPEGKRSPSGELLPFKPGLGMLLEHYPAPVVPVFVHGTHEALPPGKILPRFKQITLVFGRPLDPRDLEQQGQGDEPHDRIVQALHDHIAELGETSKNSALAPT